LNFLPKEDPKFTLCPYRITTIRYAAFFVFRAAHDFISKAFTMPCHGGKCFVIHANRTVPKKAFPVFFVLSANLTTKKC